MIYWATETIGSSFRPYYDVTNAGALSWMVEKAKKWIGSSPVPAGFALSEGVFAPAARMGAALLQPSTLDRHAARRTLHDDARAQTTC